MSSPNIQTTVVGSYPIPDWLPTARSIEAVRDATLAVLKTQENAGIDVISDGELSRFDINHPETNGMIDYFLGPMDGIDIAPTFEEIREFQAGKVGEYRKEPAAILRSELSDGRLNLVRDWEFVRSLTSHRLKFTCTGPHMLAKVVMDKHYRDQRRLAMAIAEVLRHQIVEIDAPVVQLDEANIPGSPEEAPWAAEAMNHVLSAIQGVRAVHVCFGNYGGQTIQSGHWSKMLVYLNALDTHHLVLECARRSPDEVSMLKDVRSEIGLGIGVIDIKDNAVETPEAVAGAIDRVAKAVGGADRIHYVHPDCGFWMLSRSVADRKMEALVRGRDLFEGR